MARVCCVRLARESVEHLKTESEDKLRAGVGGCRNLVRGLEGSVYFSGPRLLCWLEVMSIATDCLAVNWTANFAGDRLNLGIV